MYIEGCVETTSNILGSINPGIVAGVIPESNITGRIIEDL